MHARLFSGMEIIGSSLSSFGICGVLASMRQQMLQQRVPVQYAETAIDISLVLLTVKTSPSLIPGIFMHLAFVVGGLVPENPNSVLINKLKNACALGLYFVCRDDADVEYQAATFISATGAAWLSYKVIDEITERIGLPCL